jgi:hypothetical protein
MKNDIQEKISAIQDRISTGQAELEERMTNNLDRQLKGVTTMVEQQVHKLCEEFNGEM